jgi:hypothetical protein
MASRKTRRPKPVPAAGREPLPKSEPRIPRRWLVLAAILAAAGTAAWWWESQRPARLVSEAARLLESDPSAAAELLAEAVALKGNDDPEAQLLWTRSLVRAGHYDEALGCFQLIRDRDRLPSRQLLILAEESAPHVPLLAAVALNTIPPGSADRPWALERLLQLHARAHNWPEVLRLATELTKREPGNPAGWLAAAQANEGLFDPPAAANAYLRFLELETDPDRRLHALRPYRHLLILLGDRSGARTAHEEISQLQPLRAADRVELARLLRLEGRLEEAEAAANEVTADDREFIDAVALRGMLALDRGDPPAAEAHFRAVLAVRRYDKAAHYGLAQALQRQGQTQDAGVHFAENRRLTNLSNRIVQLQSEQLTGDAERRRLEELATVYDELGQFEASAAMRRRLEQVGK